MSIINPKYELVPASDLKLIFIDGKVATPGDVGHIMEEWFFDEDLQLLMDCSA